MDLNTVAEVVSPARADQWRPGDAWLAGGTSLFAEPHPHVRRLLDLAAAGWPSLTVSDEGLEIAATCTVAELAAFAAPLNPAPLKPAPPAPPLRAATPSATPPLPASGPSAPPLPASGRSAPPLPASGSSAPPLSALFAFTASLAASPVPAPELAAFHAIARGCCDSFVASFKIWNVATVGGNLCAALPAGPMISLTAALDGDCLLLAPDGSARRVPVASFVTGNATTVLAEGELLRSIHLPARALAGVATFRQGSLHTYGRSAALLIGRRDLDGRFTLTVTGSTWRPYQLTFPAVPAAETLQVALAERIPPDAYVDDVHGLPAWRRHLTRAYAEEIRQELTS